MYKDYENRQAEIKNLLNKLAPKIEKCKQELETTVTADKIAAIAHQISVTPDPAAYDLGFYLDADDKNVCFQIEYDLNFGGNLRIVPQIREDWTTLQQIREEEKSKRIAYPNDFPPLPNWNITATPPARSAEKTDWQTTI